MLVFEERGKLENPEKNLSEQEREPITNDIIKKNIRRRLQLVLVRNQNIKTC